MNYQKIYDQIIDRARDRELYCYKEKHHVTPKCLGGSNTKDNLVELTAREHFICHWLLCRIYPQDRKLAKAFKMMCQGKNTKQQRYTPSSRTISEAKELDRQARSGVKKTQEAIDKRTATRRARDNYRRTEESIRKGVMTKQQKGNISYGPLSEKHKEKLSEIKKKPIKQFTLDKIFVNEYPSLSAASKEFNLNISGISRAATGKVQSYKGFIWKYA